MEYPDLLDSPLAPELFKQDAIDRAKELREEMGSVGAYTANKGDAFIRQNVADWLESASWPKLWTHMRRCNC
jgi:alanine transaminase